MKKIYMFHHYETNNHILPDIDFECYKSCLLLLALLCLNVQRCIVLNHIKIIYNFVFFWNIFLVKLR